MSKKIIAWCMSIVFMMGFFTACKKMEPGLSANGSGKNYGDTGGISLPITDKNLTLSVLVQNDFPETNKTFAVQELQQRTGITIKTTEVPVANIREKAKLLISSGQIPDIMAGESLSLIDINRLGVQGAFAPLNKYIDQMPNFKKNFVDNPQNSWVFKSLVAEDDNLYYYPKFESERKVNHGFLYRKDIFDKHGIPEWKSTEEFYQALKKLKELYPNSKPYVSKNKMNIFRDWGYGWGINAPLPYYNEETQIWKLSTTQQEYKDMLDFMKKLINEGLMDLEILTDTQASWTGKITQKDKAFVTFDWIGRLDMFYEQVKAQIPEYDLRYASPIGPVRKGMSLSNVGLNGFGILVANNNNSQTSLKLVDYLSSPSGTELMTMGIEGVTYKKDESGKIKYPEFPEDKKIGIDDLAKTYGMFIPGLYTRMDKRSVYFDLSKKEQEAQDKMVNNNLLQPMDPLPAFKEDELKIINEYQQKLETAASDFSTKYILDKSYGEAQWNEWLVLAKSLGEDKLIEVYNQAQKRYNGN